MGRGEPRVKTDGLHCTCLRLCQTGRRFLEMMRCHQRPGVRECGVYPRKAGIARKCSLVMFDRPPEPVIRALVPVETAFQVQVMSFAVVSGGAARTGADI